MGYEDADCHNIWYNELGFIFTEYIQVMLLSSTLPLLSNVYFDDVDVRWTSGQREWYRPAYLHRYLAFCHVGRGAPAAFMSWRVSVFRAAKRTLMWAQAGLPTVNRNDFSKKKKTSSFHGASPDECCSTAESRKAFTPLQVQWLRVKSMLSCCSYPKLVPHGFMRHFFFLSSQAASPRHALKG